MKLKNKSLQLVLKEEENLNFDFLFDDLDDLYNMSETRLYPNNLPTEMIFEIIKDKVIVGFVKLNRIRWFNRKAEISLAIKKDHQRSGVGTEALELIIEYGFKKMNLHRLEAEVIEYNDASMKLISKFNFKEEGRLREAKYSNGKYWDIIRYGLLRNEYGGK